MRRAQFRSEMVEEARLKRERKESMLQQVIAFIRIAKIVRTGRQAKQSYRPAAGSLPGKTGATSGDERPTKPHGGFAGRPKWATRHDLGNGAV